MRRGQVSGMALTMQPGCEEGSGLHAAFGAGNDGRRSRMCIPGGQWLDRLAYWRVSWQSPIFPWLQVDT